MWVMLPCHVSVTQKDQVISETAICNGAIKQIAIDNRDRWEYTYMSLITPNNYLKIDSVYFQRPHYQSCECIR